MPNPAFFDIFGAAAFLFITTVALWGLVTRKPFPRSVVMVLLLVGIGGLIVDMLVVYTYFLR